MKSAPEDILLGNEATEEAIMQRSASGDLARYRYIHFATHGILGLHNGEQPALVLSTGGGSKMASCNWMKSQRSG